MLFDNLKDIIKHTKPFFQQVLIKHVDGKTYIEAMDDNQTIMLYATLNNTIPEIKTSIGLTRLSIIDGMLNFPAFNVAGSTTSFKYDDKNGEKVLSEIHFSSTSGHNSTYRLMSSSVAEKKIQVPPFLGVKWDVTIKPTIQNIKDLSYFNGVLGSDVPTVRVSVKNNKIIFYIGADGSDRTSVVIADSKTNMQHEWSWTLSQILTLLKLGDSSDCTMYFSDQGAMKIELKTGLAVYEYILPPMRI